MNALAFCTTILIKTMERYLLLRVSNSLQYREGHEVFSVVTCPVEYGTDNPSGSVNKLVLGIKHSSNESLTL